MLSKVAERVYWTGRYLERVESTARLLSIYDMLLFDLPRSVKLSWYNLITINSLQKDFHERYSVQDERNVVKFMLGDETNPSSVTSSINAVRENIRTTRDLLPEETWESVNELSIFVQANLADGIKRSNRHEFLQDLIKGCQQIIGLLFGNMPHDPAWQFLRLGRKLERADMTTRNLDAGIAAILEIGKDESAVNSRQIIWGNVLRSLNADQSYRRSTRSEVSGVDVVYYLLQDPYLPRALGYCLDSMGDAAGKLPRGKGVQKHLLDMRKVLDDGMSNLALDMSFRDYLNQMQIQLAQLHNEIGATWFPQVR